MEILTVHEKEIPIIELLKRARFAASNSDARRLIEGCGIKMDGETVRDIYLITCRDAVLSRGKNKFVQIRFESG